MGHTVIPLCKSGWKDWYLGFPNPKVEAGKKEKNGNIFWVSQSALLFRNMEVNRKNAKGVEISFLWREMWMWGGVEQESSIFFYYKLCSPILFLYFDKNKND